MSGTTASKPRPTKLRRYDGSRLVQRTLDLPPELRDMVLGEDVVSSCLILEEQRLQRAMQEAKGSKANLDLIWCRDTSVKDKYRQRIYSLNQGMPYFLNLSERELGLFRLARSPGSSNPLYAEYVPPTESSAQEGLQRSTLYVTKSTYDGRYPAKDSRLWEPREVEDHSQPLASEEVRLGGSRELHVAYEPVKDDDGPIQSIDEEHRDRLTVSSGVWEIGDAVRPTSLIAHLTSKRANGSKALSTMRHLAAYVSELTDLTLLLYEDQFSPGGAREMERFVQRSTGNNRLTLVILSSSGETPQATTLFPKWRSIHDLLATIKDCHVENQGRKAVTLRVIMDESIDPASRHEYIRAVQALPSVTHPAPRPEAGMLSTPNERTFFGRIALPRIPQSSDLPMEEQVQLWNLSEFRETEEGEKLFRMRDLLGFTEHGLGGYKSS